MGNPSQADRSRDLAELQSLALEVQSANDLQRVKEIFYRVQEILQVHPSDPDVQNSGTDLKQLVLMKGKRIQEAQAAGITPPPPPPGPGTYVVDPARDNSQRIAAPPPIAQTPVAPVSTPMPPKANGATMYQVAPPPPPPPRISAPPALAAQAPPPQPPLPPARKLNWKGPVFGGAGLAIALFLGVVYMTSSGHKPSSDQKATENQGLTAKGSLDIQTTPPGAAIRVNGAPRGTSNAKIEDAPGSYEIEASLEGYEPAKTRVNLEGGKTTPVSLTLTPSGQTVQLNTDLDAGSVILDNTPPKELQSGSATLEHVPAGAHKLLVKGARGDASFNFTVQPGGLAQVQPPVKTRNLVAILLSSNGKQAKLQSSSPKPVKVLLDGKELGSVTSEGLDVSGVPPGDHELTWTDTTPPLKLQLHFTPAPSLTARLVLDINAGTLIVAAGEEKTKVFLDGKELKQTTVRGGQLRIPGLPVKAYTVRVVKDGFQNEPEQQVKIKKGEETRIEFHLKPMPRLSSLQIRGARPGASILFDGDPIGAVLPDGTFTASGVSPGEHTVELRAERFSPVKIKKKFEAGKPVEIGSAEAAMQAVAGKVTLTVSPANSTVYMQGPGENQPHAIRDTTLPSLPEGSYVFSAEASGYQRKSVTVQVSSGQNRTVDLTLAAVKKAGPAASGMGDWVDPTGWEKSDNLMVHKGGNFVLYRPAPTTGVFEFTASLLKAGGAFKQRPLQWILNYENPKTYLLYQMDKKYFYRKIVINGDTKQLAKVPHGLEGETSYTIRIEVNPESIVHKLKKGGGFQEIDTHSDSAGTLSKGRFGFLIKGDDEVGLSGFSFTPK